MTHLIRTSLVALSLAALSGNALAQNAPIRIGPGGAEYQTGPTAEQLMARQAARITDLEEQLSRLTGRIEQMEFRLAERESAYEDALEAAFPGRLDIVPSSDETAWRNERFNGKAVWGNY